MPSFFIRFFVLTKWSGALKNHPVISIFMDRKSRHNSLTVLKPHLFYSTYLSNYYFSEILLLFVEFTHSTTESWQLSFFEFFGGKDRPWRSWWRSMGAVLPYNVEESWLLCGAATLPDNRQEFIWFSPAAEWGATLYYLLSLHKEETEAQMVK